MAKITFYGGAGMVTGANFLLEVEGKRILVDCGSTEQERVCDPENTERFVYDASAIDTLFVTHAHQDHIGRIPKLMREGFRGTIYSTPPTKDLAALMLDDAAKIASEEAERFHCEVPFDEHDIDHALSLWQTRGYHDPLTIDDIEVEFLNAGHVLGSSMVKFTRQGRSIIFTGDLGNSPEPLLNDTESPEGASYLVMESVYGDRVHEDRSGRRNILREAVQDAIARRGTLLIPSFSLERTQILLYELHDMIEKGELEPIPVFLDAPLAIRVTEVFRRYPEYFNETIRAVFERHEDPFTFEGLAVTEKSHASHKIAEAPDPKIIIAGAGMSGGGRVRDHEKRILPEKSAGLLFVGYQAPGTLGRRIAEGAKEVTIDHEHVSVRAAIANLTGYSGHKDRDGLLSFVEQAGESLEKVFVVMGEPQSSLFLAQRVRDFIGVEAAAPEQGDSVDIEF